MTRHFLIVIGRFKFCDWHIYWLRPHVSVSGRHRWRMWDRVLCLALLCLFAYAASGPPLEIQFYDGKSGR
jgi:hypothetical protein